ncbi:FtsX-like permease family protein [Glaciihabitans sp. dw_435]|uniref:FtsX-like permease family protein n=1 Tax=Glaciihabitans sp. dw_435 TaxID=2720081 RepID=UPI001BD34518|nr:FtsX-like permease family protein [Glaciihabitans sp. dw_435]
MTTTRLLLHRARSSLSGLAALSLVTFVTAMVLGVSLGLVSAGTAAGSRSTLDNAAAPAAAVRVTTHLGEDPAAQDSAASAVFGELFPAGTTTTVRSERSLPLDLRVVGTTTQPEGATAVFGVEPRLATDTRIVDGTLPASGIPDAGTVALQVDAATRLGARVGDTIVVGTGTQEVGLTLAATWRASDPAAPQWFADSSIGAGQIDGASGLFVVSPETLVRLPTQFFVRWTIVAKPAAVSAGQIDAVSAGVDRLPHAVEVAPDLVLTSSTVEGSLGATLGRIIQSSRAAQAIAAAPICIVGMLGIVALLQLCSLLVSSRRDQIRLARARGLSVRQLAGITVAEAVGVALPGAVIGSVLAAGVVDVIAGTTGVASLTEYIALDVGIVILTVLGLLGVTIRDVLGASEDREPRRSPIGFLLIGAAIAVAAGLSTWQLFSQGTPLSGTSVNVIASAGPALALIAVAVIGTAFVIPVSSLLAGRASRRRSLTAVLATRQVARRTAHYLVPVLAVSIAVASGAVASGMNATWLSTQRATQLATIATDVNVTLTPSATATDATPAVTSADFATIDGARSAMSLIATTASVSSEKFAFIAAAPDSLTRVLGSDGAEVAGAMTAGPSFAGVPVPSDTTGLTASVDVTGGGTDPSLGVGLFAWVADADGALSRVSLAAQAPSATPVPSGGAQLSGTLPRGAEPFSVLAFAAERPGMPDAPDVSVTLTALASAAGNAGGTPISLPGSAMTLTLTGDVPVARALLGEPASTTLPVVATRALADRLGLTVGDTLTLGIGSSPLPQPATLTATVTAIPGSASSLAFAADITAVDSLSLATGTQPARTSAVWISTAHPAAVAAEVIRSATSPALVATAASSSVDTTLAPAINAFWLAAAGAIVLALIALAASIRGDSRARRAEVSVLRALGLTAAQQGAARAREHVITLCSALVIGVIAGLIAVAVTVTPFAAAAVPGAGDILRISPDLGFIAWGAALLVLAVCCVVVVAQSVAQVRRRARVAMVEESRA